MAQSSPGDVWLDPVGSTGNHSIGCMTNGCWYKQQLQLYGVCYFNYLEKNRCKYPGTRDTFLWHLCTRMLNRVTDLRIEFCSYLATTTGSCIRCHLHWWHCDLFLQHSGRTETLNVICVLYSVHDSATRILWKIKYSHHSTHHKRRTWNSVREQLFLTVTSWSAVCSGAGSMLSSDCLSSGQATVLLVVSHTRTVVRECCKDDDQSQWRRANFNPPPPLNHLTDPHQNLHRRLRRGYLPPCKILFRSDKGFRFRACATSRTNVTRLFIVALWNWADHYIFAL